MRKVLTSGLALILALLLCLTACTPVAEVTPTVAPTPAPTSVQPYAMPLQNIKAFTYIPERIEQEDAAYEAALALARLYMEDLAADSEERTFKITQYRDLAVTLHPTLTMDESERDSYGLVESEIGEGSWVVDIGVTYQYEGFIDTFGYSSGQWVEYLYQGDPIGFLLIEEEGQFTLQSRWETVRGNEDMVQY